MPITGSEDCYGTTASLPIRVEEWDSTTKFSLGSGFLGILLSLARASPANGGAVFRTRGGTGKGQNAQAHMISIHFDQKMASKPVRQVHLTVLAVGCHGDQWLRQLRLRLWLRVER